MNSINTHSPHLPHSSTSAVCCPCHAYHSNHCLHNFQHLNESTDFDNNQPSACFVSNGSSQYYTIGWGTVLSVPMEIHFVKPVTHSNRIQQKHYLQDTTYHVSHILWSSPSSPAPIIRSYSAWRSVYHLGKPNTYWFNNLLIYAVQLQCRGVGTQPLSRPSQQNCWGSGLYSAICHDVVHYRCSTVMKVSWPHTSLSGLNQWGSCQRRLLAVTHIPVPHSGIVGCRSCSQWLNNQRSNYRRGAT